MVKWFYIIEQNMESVQCYNSEEAFMVRCNDLTKADTPFVIVRGNGSESVVIRKGNRVY